MQNFATVLLLKQITMPFVLIIFVVAFALGFMLKFQASGKSSKNLAKLQRERKMNKERISALNERLETLKKKTLI